VLCVAALGSIGVLLSLAAPSIRVAPLLIVFIFYILHSVRNFYGSDGADQMNIVVFSAAFVNSVFPECGLASRSAEWFVFAQLNLSYLIAGIAKLSCHEWRSGKAIAGIMATEMYGSGRISKCLKRSPMAAVVLCWAVIIFECTFPFALWVSREAMISLFVLGILFHAGCAVIMGLNGFAWAFLATYPTVYCVWSSTSNR